MVAASTRGLDAHGAKAYHAKLSYVDKGRIGVIGASHGGWSVFSPIGHETTRRLQQQPFRAAVAIYPHCDGPDKINAPILVLVGGIDEWASPRDCRPLLQSWSAGPHVGELKVYRSVHHGFDIVGEHKKLQGRIWRYDAEAAADAMRRVRAFLNRHLARS